MLKKQKHKKEHEGFTVIELLLVISIISFIASIILVGSVNARRKARDTKKVADFAQFQKALELYGLQNQQTYPLAGNITAVYNGTVKWNSDLTTAMSGILNSLPKPPEGSSYIYLPSGSCITLGIRSLLTDSVGYALLTTLEEPNSKFYKNSIIPVNTGYYAIGTGARYSIVSCP